MARKKLSSHKRKNNAESENDYGSDSSQHDIEEQQSDDNEDDEEEIKSHKSKKSNKKKRRIRDDHVIDNNDDNNESDEEEIRYDNDDDEELPVDPYDDEFYLLNNPSDRQRLGAMKQVEREAELLRRADDRQAIQERIAVIQRNKQQQEDRTSQQHKDRRKSTRRSSTNDTVSASRLRRGELDKRGALADLAARFKGKDVSGGRKQSDMVDDELIDDDDDVSVEDSDEYDESRARRRDKQRRNKSYTSGERITASEAAYLSDDDDDVTSDINRDRLDSTSLGEVKITTKTTLRLQDVKQLQIRRTALEKLIDAPYLNDYIKNMFVLVVVGSKQGSGEVAYRLGQIIDVQSLPNNQTYEFPARTKKYTDKAILIKHGKSERIFPFTVVSNNSIPEKEFLRWKSSMDEYNLDIITAEESFQVKRKAENLRKNFQYTAEIINQMQQQRESATHINMIPPTNIAKEKSVLLNAIADADAMNNETLKEKLQTRLNKLYEYEKQQLKKKNPNNKSIAVADTNARIRQKQLEEIASMRRDARILQSKEGKIHDVMSRRLTKPDMNAGIGNVEDENINEEKQAPVSNTDTKTTSPEKIIRRLSVDLKQSPILHGKDQNLDDDDTLNLDNVDSESPNKSAFNRRLELQHPNAIVLPHIYRTLADKSIESIKSQYSTLDLPIDLSNMRLTISSNGYHTNKQYYNKNPSQQHNIHNEYTELPSSATHAITLSEYWQRRETG